MRWSRTGSPWRNGSLRVVGHGDDSAAICMWSCDRACHGSVRYRDTRVTLVPLVPDTIMPLWTCGVASGCPSIPPYMMGHGEGPGLIWGGRRGTCGCLATRPCMIAESGCPRLGVGYLGAGGHAHGRLDVLDGVAAAVGLAADLARRAIQIINALAIEVSALERRRRALRLAEQGIERRDELVQRRAIALVRRLNRQPGGDCTR